MTAASEKAKTRSLIREMFRKYIDKHTGLHATVDTVRKNMLKRERILITYDASKPFTQANGDLKTSIITVLRELKTELIYSPTKSTIIFDIDPGSFISYRESLTEYFNSLPKSQYLYYSIALLNGSSYSDKPDYSLNHFLMD